MKTKTLLWVFLFWISWPTAMIGMYLKFCIWYIRLPFRIIRLLGKIANSVTDSTFKIVMWIGSI